MAANGIDPPGQTEEGIEVVKFMDLRKHHATSQVGARGVHLPVVLIGMPTGKIFADRGADSQQIAEGATLHRVGQFRKHGWKRNW